MIDTSLEEESQISSILLRVYYEPPTSSTSEVGLFKEEECSYPWVKVDQADGPLPPKSLSILVGLALKLDSLCIMISVVENIWTF